MKNRFIWAGAVALALTTICPLQVRADYTNSDGLVITNGVVLITTRSAIDAFWRQQSSSSLWDADDDKGPGVFSPGDAAMGELLQDYGYSVRMVPEKVLSYTKNDLSGPTVDWNGFENNPLNYYNGGGGPSAIPTNVLYSAMLVIVSGSGSSADMPPANTNGIPIIMGEHSCLGNNTVRDHSQLYLYSNKSSANLGLGSSLYMRVMATNHPIMQGIPLDSQGRVKIFRDPYPEENLHNLPSGKQNYEISWTAVDCADGKSVPAPGLTTIGVLDSATNQVVFAVMEAGGELADTTSGGDTDGPWYGLTKAPSRVVHFYVNEGGSGNTRRAFNALTIWGRIIFIRTCKWAMGETLQPYKSFNIIDVGLVSPKQIKLTWQGALDKNYRIDGTTDFANWQPIVDSILGGTNGLVSRTLDISSAPQAVFMRVAALP